MTKLDEAVEKIGWESVDSDGPDERAWKQLVAKFAAKGYARLLATGEEPVTLALEYAHPSVDQGQLCDALGVCWKAEGAIIVTDVQTGLLDILIRVDKVVGIVASDETDVAHALAELAQNSGDSEPEEVAERPADSEPSDSESDKETEKESSQFETIGDPAVSDKPTTDDPFDFAIHATTSHIDVATGFTAAIEPTAYARLEETLRRNLRAKYDVSARTIPRPESSAGLEFSFAHTLYLRVIPDDPSDRALRTAEENITGYFKKIDELAAAGIDPLVFLGVQSTGSLKVTSTESLREIEVEEDEESVGEVVFSMSTEGAALKPGSFEDSRLKQPDSTGTLVDVVLRHPGYSDRNMSQVLSLLLSIEYHDALEIIEKAPIVVAWGLARERALTMKTVIEGAGGKVHLAEPGSFDVD